MIGVVAGLIGLAALYDRYALERKDIYNVSLSEAELFHGYVRIPINYTTRRASLRGATVDYWIKDARQPTTVLEGRTSRLSGASKGLNSDWIYIPVQQMPVGEGDWIITVTVRHGDSFLNPLYRIFPVQQVVEKTIHLDITEDVKYGHKRCC